jgi:hypothetical protein
LPEKSDACPKTFTVCIKWQLKGGYYSHNIMPEVIAIIALICALLEGGDVIYRHVATLFKKRLAS